MGTEKIRIGVIGVGARAAGGFGPAFNMRKEISVVALCDCNPIRMREYAKNFNGEQNYYQTPEEMYYAETLDAVLITTPDCMHVTHAISALKHGVHVLVDKPLATTYRDCRQIIAVAKSVGKTVMMGFNLRHNPVLQRLKQIVDQGQLGRIFLIENREFYDGGRTYMSRWNRLRSQSGGLWIHKGSHDFDVFQWLLGFPKPLRVSASAGINAFRSDRFPFPLRDGVTPGPSCGKCAYRNVCKDAMPFVVEEFPQWAGKAVEVDGYIKDLCMYLSDKDVHDNGLSIVEYDNGARASHMECFACSLTDRKYTIIGDLATAEVSLRGRTITVFPRWSQEVIRYELPPSEGGHGGADPSLVAEFINVFMGKTGNHSTAEHGAWATVVGEAAEIASRENRTVAINEITNKADADGGAAVNNEVGDGAEQR